MLPFYYSFLFGVVLLHMGVCIQLSPEAKQLQLDQVTTVLNYMNFSANPCEDFYDYACGNWDKFNPIPEHEQIWSVRSSNGIKQDAEIRKIVESPVDEMESGHAIQKAKDFYASCIDTVQINERGTKPLLDLLIQLGGWPAIDEKWSKDGKNWLILLAETRRLDERLIFHSYVFDDLYNESRNSLFVEYSYIGLRSRHSFLEEGKELKAYKALINDVLNFFETGDHAKEVQNIVDFETELAKIILDRNEMDILILNGHNKTTIGELQKNFTSIDWMKYFNHLHQHNFNSSEQVLVLNWDYLTKLSDLINITPTRQIYNFLMWKIVYSMGKSTGDEFAKIFFKFDEEINGVQNITPLQERCITDTVKYFPNAVGFTYVKTHFNASAKKDAEHLASLMKESFQKLIENAQWVDQASKDAALLKLKKMGIAIGYPDFILDIVKVDKFYETVQINKATYFENVISARRLLSHLQTVLIKNEVDYEIFPTSFLEISAQLNYRKQKVFVTAPQLQPAVYHKDFPKFMNFGGIGKIISNEIGRGFDSVGMTFDSDGLLKNLFGEEFMKTYKTKETCFIEKYNNYSWNKTNLIGMRVSGGAIRDDVGIKTSYFAYKKWLQENTEESILKDERINKYNLTSEKMFFISAAQLNCMAILPEAWSWIIKYNPQAVRHFRVNGFLSNFNSFSEVFQCPPGSPMNSTEKCAIF